MCVLLEDTMYKAFLTDNELEALITIVYRTKKAGIEYIRCMDNTLYPLDALEKKLKDIITN